MSERTPEQIIGKDHLLQLIFEGYEVVPLCRWQPIETAPKDGRYLLVHNSLCNTHVARWGMRYLGDPGPEAWVCDGKHIGGTVTHWQPLPAPPVESKSEVVG